IALVAAPPEIVDRRIVPDIRPVSAKLPELHIIAVRRDTGFEHQDQLVLAAIERAHAGIVLDPRAEVLELGDRPRLPRLTARGGGASPCRCNEATRRHCAEPVAPGPLSETA